MKKLLIALLILACVFTLVACFDIGSGQTTTEPPHVHDWTDWVVQSVASCTNHGYQFRNCRGCGVEDGIYTPEYGHDYKWLHNESDDTIENVCLRCGDVLNSLQRIEGTPGLEYYFDEDKDVYHVVGVGDCTEEHITVPSMYNGKLVTSIDGRAFYKCEFLKSITLSDNLFYIEGSAFSGCVNLETVSIGRSSMLSYILYGAFEDCASLKSIRLPEGLTMIYDRVFNNCTSLEEIDLPSSLTHLGENVFSGCTSLKSVDLSCQITTIESRTFYGCTSLESVLIPDNITKIGKEAFGYCSSLTFVFIPDSVTTIEQYAFGAVWKIFCEAESRPNGFGIYWTPNRDSAIWGSTLQDYYDAKKSYTSNHND